jgi:hypothetical protein
MTEWSSTIRSAEISRGETFTLLYVVADETKKMFYRWMKSRWSELSAANCFAILIVSIDCHIEHR